MSTEIRFQLDFLIAQTIWIEFKSYHKPLHETFFKNFLPLNSSVKIREVSTEQYFFSHSICCLELKTQQQLYKSRLSSPGGPTWHKTKLPVIDKIACKMYFFSWLSQFKVLLDELGRLVMQGLSTVTAWRVGLILNGLAQFLIFQ